MVLGGQLVEWVDDHIKYLGIYLITGNVEFDIYPVKRSFYAAYNSVFSHSHGTNEIALLTLQEA